jgi:hypothetical protein
METTNSAPIPPATLPATLQELRGFYATIPDEKWYVGEYHFDDACCALGHLGARIGKAARIKDQLRDRFGYEFPMQLVHANDGTHQFDSFGATPKTRVLAYLDSLLLAGGAQ